MKKVIAVLVVICICLCFVPSQIARADALTASMVGAAAYAIMADVGISISGWGLNSTTTSNFMQGQVSEYLTDSGQSMVEAFGSQEMQNIAGKLAIGQELYNGIAGFLDWLVEKYDLSDFSTSLDSQVDGQKMPISQGAVSGTGPNRIVFNEGWWSRPSISVYWNNVLKTSFTLYITDTANYEQIMVTNAELQITGAGNNNAMVIINYQQRGGYIGGEYTRFLDLVTSRTFTISYTNGYDIFGSLSEDYVQPTVLNPSQEWVGQLGGQDWPDTNIDQLIGQIYQDVADNNLDVEGEIVDVGPVPTPAPTWEPVSDVIDGINSLGEEVTSLGNDIGNIANDLDDLGNVVGGLDDAIADQTGALGDAIADQTGALGDAIADQTGALGDAIADQTGALGDALADQTDSLTDSIDSVTDAVDSMADSIADALDIPAAEDITARKWSLSTLFPFCIPFDIYNMLRAFDGVAQAPHVQLPFNIQSIGFRYMIDLDFSGFDPVAAVLRQVELIVYGIALAYATSKVIRW